MASRAPRLNVHVLVIFLIAALPVLAAGTVLVMGTGYARYRAAAGEHLAEAAEQTAGWVDMFVFRRILGASVLAQVPDIRDVAATGSRQPWNPDAVRQLDLAWARDRKIPTALASVLTNPAARFLSEVGRTDAIVRAAFVTDRYG